MSYGARDLAAWKPDRNQEVNLPDLIRRRPSAQQLVYTILDDAELVGAVQQVDANLLGGLIKHVGLEDAGEILSLATPAQLRGLADEDL